MYVGAGLLLAIAFLGLDRASRRVVHYPVAIDGRMPAMVYEPGPARAEPAPEGGLPVVVLAHGIAGSKTWMGFLARSLARAGYAVVAFDFRGHGAHAQPFGAGPSLAGLVEDCDRAVLYARTHPAFDAERVAVAGYSMGGFAMLEYASHYAGVAATVAISPDTLSMGARPTGPYTPPNVLLVGADGDPGPLRAGARAAAARFAGVEQVVLGRTYGEVERGSGVRVEEVSGPNHVTILWSADAARRVAAWLGRTLGPGADPTPGGDGYGWWSLLGLVAALALLWGAPEALAPLVPAVALPSVERPGRALAALAVGLVAGTVGVGGADWVGGSAFSFIPLLAGNALIGLYALSGVLLLVWLGRGGAVSVRGLDDWRTWAAALALLLASYVAFGTVSEPYLGPWLAPHRWPAALACALLALPFFGAFEWLLRGPGPRGVWAPVAGKVILLGVIALGSITGLLSFVLFLALTLFAASQAVLELACYRLSRAAPNPWLAALYQSGWTGWTVAAAFPYL